MTSPDSLATVLKVLQHAGTPLKAAALKAALGEGGVPKADVDKVWRSVQPRLKAHSNVVAEGLLYRWTDEAPALSPQDALAALLKSSRLSAARKDALADLVRAALGEPAGAPRGDDAEAAARVNQAEVDGARTLADLASEVEELIDNETEPKSVVRQVRAWVKRSGLDPIGHAGEETRFDRKLHKPVGAGIRDGAAVIVVRPGYYWRAQGRDVLLGKAVVEE